MFSQDDFLKASRSFVCVRLESYESKEHQEMVRSFLDGRFENTAFCLLAPNGKERLSGTGRSPAMGLRQRRPGAGRPGSGPDGGNDLVIEAMQAVAKKYPSRAKPDEAVVQDFHTFRQSLNVASGDQRLLFLIVAGEDEREALRASLRPVLADPRVLGRFHSDFASPETDADWHKTVQGVESRSGLFIIRADQFGQKGSVMERLPLDARHDEIVTALLKANATFAATEQRKVYSAHVAEGRREKVYFENAVPYGEDRDGDGEIDHRGGLGGPPPGGPPRGGPPPGRRPGPPPGPPGAR